MRPVQMLSLMYLIYSKKQRKTFLTHLAGRLCLNVFTLIKFCSASHWAPIFPGLSAKPVPAETALSDFLSNCLAHFYVVCTGRIFPAKYFICSKGNANMQCSGFLLEQK